MIIVFILCVFLLILSLILSKNNILSPAVVTSGVWIFCLLLFWTLNHRLPPLSTQFLGSLSIWVALLSIFSLLMQSVSFKVESEEPSSFVRDVFFWISIVTYPAFLFFVRDALAFGNSGNWSSDLRMAAIGKTAHFKEIYGGIQLIIWQVSYIIELFYYSRKNRNRVFILGFFFLSFAFLTMSKAAFLEFFIKTVCILYFKKKIKVSHILIGIGALFFLMAGLQAVRNSKKADTVDKNDLVVLYVLGNMSAFDTVMPESSTNWGENVFHFYYSAAYKLGFIKDKPKEEALLPFIKKPISTNTYTGMYPFFKDFGNWGVAVFAILFGLLYGYVFNKAQRGSVFNILLYTTFLQFILMQYVAEMFFTALVGYIKYIILLAIPFWAAKMNIFNKDKFFKAVE